MARGVENSISTEVMERFLSQDCCKSSQEEVSECWAVDLVARDVVGDVLEETGKPSYFEDFVEGN